jgi:hypothetical protein
MIADESVAKEIADMLLNICESLNETVVKARERCPREEFQVYRRAVGAVLAEINDELLNPLFSTHPALEPLEPSD